MVMGKHSGCNNVRGNWAPFWQHLILVSASTKLLLSSSSEEPLFSGEWVMSWSKNCPHCINNRVKSLSGWSSLDINAELSCLGDGKYEFPVRKEMPRGTEMPRVYNTVFENHRKSLIQHCERSELRLQKFIKKPQNGPIWRVFENLKLEDKQCYQTCQS